MKTNTEELTYALKRLKALATKSIEPGQGFYIIGHIFDINPDYSSIVNHLDHISANYPSTLSSNQVSISNTDFTYVIHVDDKSIVITPDEVRFE